MKNKTILLGLLFLLAFMELNAQTPYFYYYKGEKQYLTLDKTKLNITVSSYFQKESKKKSEFEILDLNNDLTTPNLMLGNIKFNSESKETKYEEIVNLLEKEENIIAVHPNFITVRNIEIGMSSYFYVRLKKASDYDLLNKMAEQKGVLIVEQNRFLPLWYTLRCTKETPDNTLNIANYFYETGLFASAVPDFLSDDLVCTNDPNFYQLWGLNNSTYSNIDINICDAWNIARGKGITVAVLDQGIELTHSDLQTNISHSSYNTESNSSPSQIFGSHGTHCAGIIGAVGNNNIQIVGVAPECKLMSVSNSLASVPNSRMKRADGINWAWKNGADIISNSWGSSVQYDIIDEAIDSALIYGRSGRGTVVIFASGNEYSAVAYPANSNPDIIAVGAISINGAKADFSNYGQELDIVSPGVNILSTVLNNGIAPDNGTSMAAPHVAGVAALILSVNPNLTQKQVANIIEQTAQKTNEYSSLNLNGYIYSTLPAHPNGTWNNEMGYGLVDAYEAVRRARSCWRNVHNRTIRMYTQEKGCVIDVKNTIVKTGHKLLLNAKEEVNISSGFELEDGAELEILINP